MKKIGILGGTFNPLHIGHLAIAQAAQEKMGLDKIIFVPSAQPPHKRITHLASAQDRLEMVCLSIKNNPNFDFSDYEVRKGGKSYTVDTVKHFYEEFGAGTKLFFILGGDAACQLHTWRRVSEIIKYVTFIVVNRPGHDDCVSKIPHHSITMPGLDISSSYVRGRILQGKSIKYLVPEEVFRYIESHKIY
ncbi:MAG: nicotinate-nucleotide adenylyltransferase [Candidatus Omnitrophota bacterium]